MGGFNLPPGCSVSDIPGNQPVGPCECCGREIEGCGVGGCICPECPECGWVGDPACYPKHGLRYTVQQVVGRDNTAELIRLSIIAEQKFWQNYEEEIEEWAF